MKKISDVAGFERISQKKESMGICFIGKRKSGFADFLSEYTQPNPGPIVDIETYKQIGEHKGIQYWTQGQRIAFPGFKYRRFIADKDGKTNTLYVCSGSDHPALYSENFFTDEPYWIDQAPEELRDRANDQTLHCQYRSQNTQPLADVAVSYGMASTSNWESISRKSLVVSISRPERALTPGQYAVFYRGDECLGSARMVKIGPSLYTMNKDNCRDALQSNKTSDVD